MPFGLFGKLPQKRDFLSINLPTAVLNPFETWLQSAVTASRSEIGRNWENYYLVAPIWHFWLGKDILGTAITGSLMPSVDQVGRYFPLAIIYYAGPGETLVPPLVNPIEDWYAAIDERLLSVLAENAQVDPGALLGGLQPPDYSSPPPYPLPIAPLRAAAGPAEAPATSGAPSQPAAPEPPPAAELAWDEAPVQETTHAADPVPPEAVPDVEAPPVTEASSEGRPDDDIDWAPEPMSAERLAELDRIAAASYAPDSVWSKVNAPATEEPAESPVPAAAEPAIAAAGDDLWDAPAMPAAPAAEVPEAASEHDRGAIAVLSRSPEAAETPAPEPAPVTEPPPGEPSWTDGPAVDETGAPAAEPEIPAEPPRHIEVFASEFKGGLVSAIEGGASLTEALPRLMALDIEHTAQTRGYWWCGASSSGGPRLYAKSGLPDPYLYSRMLMWNGN